MMLAHRSHPSFLLPQSTSLSGFLKALWDPASAVLVIFVVNALHGGTINGPIVLLAVLLFAMLYPGHIPLHAHWLAALRNVMLQWVPAFTVLVLLGFGTRSLDMFSTRLLLEWALAVPLVWFASHLLLPLLAPRLFAMEGIRSAVIVGANEIGRRLASQFEEHKHLGVHLLGFFDDRGAQRLADLPATKLLGRFDQIAAYVRQTHTDAIFIALPMTSQPRILKLLDDLKDSTVSLYFVPDIFVTDLIQARVDEVGGIPVVAVRETPFKGMNGMIKRLSDILLAGAILVATAPLLLVIALAVRLSSPGPVLFRQRRYGLDGREIVVYKFRTMTVCEDGDNVVQATRGDQRITRVGAFLRKRSLDELPQLFNVLLGSMSVVGPRPHAVTHNELYRGLIKGYMVRHKVKPGITGLAQVNGCRGETDTIDKMQKRIEYDLEYLRKWSLRLDIEIVLRTIGVLFKDKNAY